MKSKIIIFLACAISMVGCKNAPTKTLVVEPIAVKVAMPICDTIAKSLNYVGTIEEQSATSVSFSVSGTIQKVYVKEGDRVVAGQLLASLNNSSLGSIYNAAKAQRTQAEDAMERVQLMYDNESVAEVKYVDIQTKLEQARANEEVARKNLDDCVLRAPISGVVGSKMVEVGENIAPNQGVMTIVDINHSVMFKLPVPELEIAHIALGQSATIKVAALGENEFHGVVAERGVVADPFAHSYNVLVRIDSQNGELLPGMVGSATIEGVDERGVVLLPSNVVQRAGNGDQYVWTIERGDVKRRVIETGALYNQGVEIVSGVSECDSVVCQGYHKLYDGVDVKVVE